MPFDIQEYRKKHTKIVKAPSGFDFTIRPLPMVTIARMMAGKSTFGDLISDPETAFDDLINNPEPLEEILQFSVIYPKISCSGSDNVLSVDEIHKDDIVFLINEIINFSGLRVVIEEKISVKEEISVGEKINPSPIQKSEK